MNHSPSHGLHIRRIRIRPADDGTALLCRPQEKRSLPQTKNPLIIRRTYDITAACTRLNDAEEDAPLTVHIRGERAVPLLRCVVIGAAAIGIAVSVSLLGRMSREWQVRRKYARKYAERLKEQRFRMQLRRKSDGASSVTSDAKP